VQQAHAFGLGANGLCNAAGVLGVAPSLFSATAGHFSLIPRALGIGASALASDALVLGGLANRLVGMPLLGAVFARDFRGATLLFGASPAALGVSLGFPRRFAHTLTCGSASRRRPLLWLLSVSRHGVRLPLDPSAFPSKRAWP
jgi:hypothetical protein